MEAFSADLGTLNSAHTTWSDQLEEQMRAEALRAGFDLAGIASCPASDEPEGRPTADRFAAWIAAGNAGEMEYLKRTDPAGELLRSSAKTALPWARSMVVCAMNYHAPGPLSIEPPHAEQGSTSGWIARYAWNGDAHGNAVDYHVDMMARLKKVEAWLSTQAMCEMRCYVDTGPLLERDFAARSGVGWIGKNTCVLNEEFGSWLLLGVIVTSLPTAMTIQLAADRCGTCTRCIDACPTNALVQPRTMDASLCIAYLTIEKKGTIAEELRAPMGRQVFGCDICQEVCPWNRKVPVASKDGLMRRDELVNPDLAWLAGLDSDGFKRLFAGSPLERTKLPRLQRNLAIAMGNSGNSDFIARLKCWRSGTDAVLAEAASWALERLTEAARSSASIVQSIDREPKKDAAHDELVDAVKRATNGDRGS